MKTIHERQQREVAFWDQRDEETVNAGTPENIAHKAPDIRIFLECLQRYRHLFETDRILEIGGGQSWASCVVKHYIPGASVTATDISQTALFTLPAWERIFEVTTDGHYACTSDRTKERDSSIGLVFAFAAAHHFATHRKTFIEIERILKPGGHALYLYEPTCSEFWHPFAHARVNRKRPEVPEDVLISSRVRALAENAGLKCQLDYYPSVLNRGPKQTLYYSVLASSRILQKTLPCTANFIFTKP